MRGDFSRDSFDRQKSFSRVMMQQGRVQIDADWNEQTSLTLDYVRTLTRDLVGPGAGPIDHCGFEIQTLAQLPAAPASETDEFAEERTELTKGDLLLKPGRYYVGGLAINLNEQTYYSRQAGYPFDEATRIDKLDDTGADWIAYLDVWEEFLSADQDESIGEPALGGIDTCGRAVIRWQVRILQSPSSGAGDVEAMNLLEPGTMSAKTKQGEAPDTPCVIPPDARYRGVENQLYRVEIHKGSDADGNGATFKWSRDNGSVIYPVKRADDTLLTLAHLGRDEASTIQPGRWVELNDDRWIGHDPGGPLAKVEEVRRDERKVLVAWADSDPGVPMHEELHRGLRPVLRRWDHESDDVANGGALAVQTGKDIELEDGILIHFHGGHYRAGDYWLIPARVATGDILWPGEPKKPDHLPPHGPKHFYAPLASLKSGTFKDLRKNFKIISKAV